MAEQTEDILEGLEPPAPAAEETPVEAPETEPVTPAAEEPTEAPAEEVPAETPAEETPAETPAAEPAAEEAPAADPQPGADLPALQAQYATASQELQAVSSKIAEYEKQIEADTFDNALDGPKLMLLQRKELRLQQQMGQLQRQASEAQTASLASHWNALGQKHKDLAETPAAATKLLQTLWDEEYAKAETTLKGAHPERIAGRAEAAWEQRIARLKAEKLQKPAAGAGKPPLKPSQRLTPGTGSVPPATSKEPAAAQVARTLGALKDYKF
jgi:hypothetical protein